MPCENIELGIVMNEQKPCKVLRCPDYRVGLSGYCQKHKLRHYQYGHPQGYHFKQDLYANEELRIRKIIERNMDHDGVVHALDRMEYVIHQCREGRGDIPGLLWGHHAVIRRNPEPIDLLALMGALALLYKYEVTPLKSQRAFLMALGWQFFRWGRVPCLRLGKKLIPRTHKPTTRLACGKYLYRLAGVMARNLADKAYKEMMEENYSNTIQNQLLD